MIRVRAVMRSCHPKTVFINLESDATREMSAHRVFCSRQKRKNNRLKSICTRSVLLVLYGRTHMTRKKKTRLSNAPAMKAQQCKTKDDSIVHKSCAYKDTIGRPPTLFIPPHRLRHDIDSEEMRRVHFDLPSTAQGRISHLQQCDMKAYNEIKDSFPGLTPPHMD